MLYIFCTQNHLLHFGLLSYNRHMSCATKSFIEKMWGVWRHQQGRGTGSRCLASGGHHLCVPCGWSSSQPGLHPSSSFSSCLSPSSCGTCGGGRSLIYYGVMMVGKQEGHWSPGNQQWEPCHPFWGWLWMSLHGCYHLCDCWACCLSLWQTS